MRWTRQRFARNVMAGRVGERPVSDQQRADERCCSVRRSRVVLTPRRWRQVRGVASAQPGLDKTYPLMTVAKEPGHRGARRKPLKPLRAGTPGDSGVLVVTRVRSTNSKCTRGCGCQGHPAFPTPSKGRELHQRLGRIAPRDRECASGLAVIASAAKQSILSLRGAMDCFASLAMTARALDCFASLAMTTGALGIFAEPVIGRAFARPALLLAMTNGATDSPITAM